MLQIILTITASLLLLCSIPLLDLLLFTKLLTCISLTLFAHILLEGMIWAEGPGPPPSPLKLIQFIGQLHANLGSSFMN